MTAKFERNHRTTTTPGGGVPRVVSEVRPRPIAKPEEVDSLRQQIAAAAVLFGKTLPDRVDAIREALELASLGSAVAFAEARKLCHRLRGTAGCYGFHAVGDAAGRVGDKLEGRNVAHASDPRSRASLALGCIAELEEQADLAARDQRGP
ncbi:MAG: Hpt domain-containing protein [Polyangiaceae bacterium]